MIWYLCRYGMQKYQFRHFYCLYMLLFDIVLHYHYVAKVRGNSENQEISKTENIRDLTMYIHY